MSGNNWMQIDISEYQSGIYFLKIETKDFTAVKKILITKEVRSHH
jgi:hypothetical protein